MDFDYTIEQIDKDIENYIKAGAFPYCSEPAFAKDFEEYIAEDKKELERLGNSGDNKTLFVNYQEMVSKKYSGLYQRTHNFHLVKEAFKKWGGSALSDLRDVNLFKGSIKQKKDHFTVYNPSIRSLAVSSVGQAYRSEDGKKTVVLYAPAALPLDSANSFYHEAGHMLQNVYGHFDKSTNSENYDEVLYQTYLRETHAETFAQTVLLLKAKDQKEYDFLKQEGTKKARRALVEDVGRNRRSAYNFYPMSKKVISELDDLGEDGRKMFLDENGRIDFEQVSSYTAGIVKEQAYSRDQFSKYSTYIDNEMFVDRDYSKDPGYEWLPEYRLNKVINKKSLTEKDYLIDFFRKLKSATSVEQLYDELDLNNFVDDEKLDKYRELNDEQNPRMKTYEKLRGIGAKTGISELIRKRAQKKVMALEADFKRRFNEIKGPEKR